MRILSVSVGALPEVMGGSEVVADRISCELAGAGHDVTVLAGARDGSLPREERYGPYAIRRYTYDQSGLFRSIRSIRTEARRAFEGLHSGAPFDCLIFHHVSPAAGILDSSAASDCDRIACFHGPWADEFVENARVAVGRSSWPVGLAKRLTVPFVARRLRCLQASVLERCRRVIALSDYSVRNISRLGVRDKRVVEIPGGVDLERFGPRPSRPEAAAKLGLPGDRRIVLTVRRLAGRMGLEELIRAMPDVVRLHPDVLLVVVGKGDLRGALEGLSRSAGVAEAVLFTGFAPDDDLPLYYRAAELFVLPTRSLEGFGLVTLEALSSGTPVVGTPTGATPEILRPLEESLVMAGCTSEDIAGAISGALSRNDLEDLGRRARRYVEENFSWQRAGHALLDVIAEGRPGAH